MMAAEVSMAMSQMAPTPWDATSAGNRQSRMSVSSSVDAGLRGWDPSPSDTAFTHMMTASVPPYRSDPLVLPSSSLFPASFSNSLETGRGGSGPGIRRPLNASFTALNNTEVEEDKDKEDEESSPYYYRPASAGPILSTHRSLSMLPLSAPQKSHSPRGLAEFRRSTGSIPTMSESEDEVKGDGEASRDINIGFAAKSPITPSGLSHSRTVVLPWQNPFPLPLYPGTRERESAIHFGLTPTTVDLQQRTEDPIRIPSSGSLRETEKDVNNDTNSQSSLPSVQSMLTTDTVTMAALVVAQTADAASCPPESGVASATSTLGLSSEGGSINQKKGTGRISISSKASSNREY